MNTGRRSFFSVFAMTLTGMSPLLMAAQRRMPPSTFPRFPDASGSEDNMPDLPPPDPRERLKKNQKNLRKDANLLLELSKELKQEADKTDQTDVLSVSLVRRAETIEKLARHIKDLARAT